MSAEVNYSNTQLPEQRHLNGILPAQVTDSGWLDSFFAMQAERSNQLATVPRAILRMSSFEYFEEMNNSR